MSNEVLEKVKQLPLEKQKQVEDYIDYLLSRYVALDKKGTESLAEKREKNMGWAKGQIWMAEDFNETPADFKDYM